MLTKLLLLLIPLCLGSQLVVDPDNSCRAYGNGTVFDISTVFSYPVVIKETKRPYTYWYNPCGGYQCPQGHTTVTAICQKADVFWSCGHVDDTIWVLHQYNPWIFSMTHIGGSQWRMTVVTFIEDPTVETPTITFLSEDPYEQYNFEVRGKCVGQPSFGTCINNPNGFDINWARLHELVKEDL